MHRRSFLKAIGGSSLLLASGLRWSFAQANVASQQKKLISIFLRGGMDGISLFVPYGDQHYYELRKNTAVLPPHKDNGVIKINDTIGLNPRAKPFLDLIKSHQILILNGVGHKRNTRSHFKEQDIWETGSVENYVVSDGWLNRYLRQTKGDGFIRGLALGEQLPRILRGEAQAFAIKGLEDLFGNQKKAQTNEFLEKAYQVSGAPEPLIASAGANMIDGLKMLKEKLPANYQSQTEYPRSNFGNRMKDVAQLLKANIGLEVIEVDVDGWDTHQNQGSVQGTFGNKVADLSEVLAAFLKDMGAQMDDTLVMVYSEFGRTAKENGTNGTDHGWGNNMMLLGNSISAVSEKNKGFYNEFTGLGPEQLISQRDIKDVIDFRDVFSNIMEDYLGFSETDLLFEDFKKSKLNFFTSV